MNAINTEDTTTREQWLNAVAHKLDTVAFTPNGYPLPAVKISCSWALGGKAKNKKTLGQCFARSASGKGLNEIMIVPTVDDSFDIADTLAHELAHAVDDCHNGHKKGYKIICEAVGLDGSSKYKYAKAGEKLTEQIKDILKEVGDYPHSAIDVSTVKKQTTRMVKVACTLCSFSYRTSRKNIEMTTNNTCNGCGEDSLDFLQGQG